MDTTTRKVVFETTPFLLSDTVGFIRKLPHHLVESFKSTLDEVREADILLHVVDVSHPRYEEQLGVVNRTLQELDAFDKPILTVFNKIDLYETRNFDPWLEEGVKKELLSELYERWQRETNGNCVFISATERRNIDDLRRTILEKVQTLYKVRYPYKTEFLLLMAFSKHKWHKVADKETDLQWTPGDVAEVTVDSKTILCRAVPAAMVRLRPHLPPCRRTAH